MHGIIGRGLRRRVLIPRALYRQIEIDRLVECLDREIRDQVRNSEHRSRDIVTSGIEEDIGSAPPRYERIAG